MTNQEAIETEICIYCKERKNIEQFNKEHVIPESFGKFNNNLTLIQMVCTECNGYFSQNLELFLARDSLDGIMRYKYSLADFDKDKKIRNRRLMIKVADHSEWEGALLELCPSVDIGKSEPDVILLPQVAFFKIGSKEKVHFPIAELASLKILEKMGLDTKKCILIANNGTDLNKVKARVIELGIHLDDAIEISPESKPKLGQIVRVITQTTIDNTILRSIAKISFNYLAKAMGKEYVLEDYFNEIREYIRYGHIRSDRPVKIVNKQILSDDKKKNSPKTDGHLVVIDWGDNYDLTIIGKVSLFNRLVYRIMLCRSYRGLHRDIACGHLFDIHTREIKKLLPNTRNHFFLMMGQGS